jgi:uncharacterized protein (TIGR02145 family)
MSTGALVCIGSPKGIKLKYRKNKTMKNLLLLKLILLVASPVVYGQDTPTWDASAALEVRSENQGFLPPRMTTAQRDQIQTPAAGLLIYNTTTNAIENYNGTSWNNMSDVNGGTIQVVDQAGFDAINNPKTGDAYLNTAINYLLVRANNTWYPFKVADDLIFYQAPGDSKERPYKTIESPVTGRVWLDRNLGAEKEPVNNASWGDEYAGRFYTWAVARTACPTGFSLPTRDEWCRELDNNVNNRTYCGFMGNSTTGIGDASDGYNNLKITLTGYRAPAEGPGTPATKAKGVNGWYWSNTEEDTQNAFLFNMEQNSVLFYPAGKTYPLSVRCIKD